MIKIIIFPAGSEIGLEIYDSLRDEKDVEIFGGASTDDFSSIVYAKDHLKKVPFVSSPDFAKSLLRVCKKEGISTIFPAHDEVIKVLADASAFFKKENIDIVIHPGKTSEICRSKIKTYQSLKGCKFLPKFSDSLDPSFDGPYFLKPSVGQGSKGVLKAKTREEIRGLSKNQDLNNYLVCELLPGKEYTVDCFTDFLGKLLFCQGRVREKTTNGISVATSKVDDLNFRKIANSIQKKIPMNGAWFYQVKENANGELRLLEVGARIAGSSSYSRFCGVNLSLMNLFNLRKLPLMVLPLETQITVQKRIKPFVQFNYDFKTVYVDFDDTVVVNGIVNLKVINFLFWCLNHEKKLVLITRHKFDIRNSLKKRRLDSLFDEIIHIKDGSCKSLSIKSKKSIFLDDSFSERMRVSKKHRIPVYSTQCLPEIY